MARNEPTASMSDLLPLELIIKVFRYLDITSILSCYAVCRLFRDLIKSSDASTYQIGLAKNGYMDRSAIELTQIETVGLLESHIEAWQHLHYRRMDKYKLNERSALWDLFGGVFAQGSADGMGGAFRKFKFRQLPSVINGTGTKEWTFEDVGVDVRDFRLCPEQDLLALIACSSRLSENEKHPRAAGDGVVSHNSSSSPRPAEWSYEIEIQGDIVGLFCRPHREQHEEVLTELVVWNWVTGETLAALTSTTNHKMGSFLFLQSSQMIIFAYGVSWAPYANLEICQLPDSAKAGSPSYPSSRIVAIYEMPQMVQESVVVAMNIRSDPPPSLKAPASTPFYPAPINRICAVSLAIVGPRGAVAAGRALYTFTIFIRIPRLLEHYRAGTISPSIIPWDTWGPSSCRFLGIPLPRTSWVCYVFGERFILRNEAGDSLVSILDFCPSRAPDKKSIPKPQVVLPDPEDETKNWPPAAIIPRSVDSEVLENGVFKECITTNLPYTWYFAGWAVPPGSHLMIDNEHILVVTQERDLHCLTF